MAISPSHPLSAILHEMADRPAESMPLGGLVRTFGSRTHGIAILLLALPEAMPLPVPSAGLFLAVPLLAVSAHLAMFGEGGGLPARVAGWRVPTSAVRVMDRTVGRWLRRAERATQARWPEIADRERLVGAVCVLASFVLMLPIPLINIPPALCLVLLAWGLVQRDGAFVLAGLMATGLLILTLAGLGAWAATAWRAAA